MTSVFVSDINNTSKLVLQCIQRHETILKAIDVHQRFSCVWAVYPNYKFYFVFIASIITSCCWVRDSALKKYWKGILIIGSSRKSIILVHCAWYAFFPNTDTSTIFNVFCLIKIKTTLPGCFNHAHQTSFRSWFAQSPPQWCEHFTYWNMSHKWSD